MNISDIGLRCCGCHNCEYICPQKSIIFKQSDEGFMYPLVTETCINCGLCLKKCPVYIESPQFQTINAYAAYNKNQDSLMKSSSGGIFSVLAKEVLSHNGYVFGCSEIVVGQPKHICINRIEDIHLLQGSKYVESDIDNIAYKIDELLNKNYVVLFSGTPCQVAAIKKLFQSENLITVDIICHGVPSRKMYNRFLEWYEQKKNLVIEEFHFRSKSKHGWSLTYKVNYKRQDKYSKIEKIATLCPYYHHFLRGLDYRESCYQCKYATSFRVGDITLGDFWGIEKVNKRFNNFEGVSAVLVNTEKGKMIWDSVKNDVTYTPVSISDIVRNNGQLNHPVQRPAERNDIYKLLDEKGYNYIVKLYRIWKAEFIDSIKDMIPNKIRYYIKKCIGKY